MKNQTFKLVMTIISTIIVVALITFGIVISLLSFKYNWNSRVDLIYVPQDVTLRFEGKINDNTFIASAENGSFDNTVWEIPQHDTTFSRNKLTITINLKFINKCSSNLQIVIAGIHFDNQNRFETYLTDENDVRIESSEITKQADGTGIFTTILAGGLDEQTSINLNYTLKETTVPIVGNENDRQNLAISISNVE